MINLKERALQKASSQWERFKITTGWTVLSANYFARNLQELKEDMFDMKFGENTILLPKLIYFPREDNYMPLTHTALTLQDESSQIEAFVRDNSINPQTMNHLGDDVYNLAGGTTLYSPVISVGLAIPYEETANGFYLKSFYLHENPRRKNRRTLDVSLLVDKAEQLLPIGVIAG